MRHSSVPAWQRAIIILTGTVVTLLVIACLYVGHAVFVPVALALFLMFLLSPVVTFLERWGLGRTISVVTTVLVMALVLGTVVWLVSIQVTNLVEGLPAYTENIKGKVDSLRQLGQGGAVQHLEKMVQDITESHKHEAPQAAAPTGAGTETPPPVVKESNTQWLSWVPMVLDPVAKSFGTLLLAFVLVFFMLLKRESLRDRLIRLVGHGNVTGTTKALDDAGERISRYLLMQLIVNSTYGMAWGLGLFLIGVDYALMWGFLAAVLRYVPYIGAPISALLPITLSLGQFPGWWQPLLAVGLVLVLELISNNVVEPLLYGHSMGVSSLAMLIAAAFWALLWGPVGLILSGPLTVCLIVIGKHVPQLEFLNVLLSDEPALDLDVAYYQRLLAHDQDEATHLVLAYVKESPLEQAYDAILLPALSRAKSDRERNELTEPDEQFVLKATEELLEDLGERRTAAIAEAAESEDEKPGVWTSAPVRILACPAGAPADRLALTMLQQLLDPEQWAVDIRTFETLSSELIEEVAAQELTAVCISAMPPGGLAHTRYLCKRLRARLPRVRIIVGRWCLTDNVDSNREQLIEAGADLVATTLTEVQNHLNNLRSLLTQEAALAAKT